MPRSNSISADREPGVSAASCDRYGAQRASAGDGDWITPGRAPITDRELEPETIDLGNEPPLSVDGGNGNVIDRRRVSAQWFSGTILTGLCGAALMGGAVFASLDGETNFATMPERVESTLRGAIGGMATSSPTRKGDRLPPAGESNGARQIIRVSTTDQRVGDREVVRVRPYRARRPPT